MSEVDIHISSSNESNTTNSKHCNTITGRISNKCNSELLLTPEHLTGLDTLTELIYAERCWILLSNCLTYVFCPFVVLRLRRPCCPFHYFSRCWCNTICVRANVSCLVPYSFPNNSWHSTSFSQGRHPTFHWAVCYDSRLCSRGLFGAHRSVVS